MILIMVQRDLTYLKDMGIESADELSIGLTPMPLLTGSEASGVSYIVEPKIDHMGFPR